MSNLLARQHRKKKEKYKSKREEFKQRENQDAIIKLAESSGDTETLKKIAEEKQKRLEKRKQKQNTVAGSLRVHRTKRPPRSINSTDKTKQQQNESDTTESTLDPSDENNESEDSDSGDEEESDESDDYDREAFVKHANTITEELPSHVKPLSSIVNNNHNNANNHNNMNGDSIDTRAFADALSGVTRPDEILQNHSDYKKNIVTNTQTERDPLDELLGLEETTEKIASLKVNPKPIIKPNNLFPSKTNKTIQNGNNLSATDIAARTKAEAELDDLLGL